MELYDPTTNGQNVRLKSGSYKFTDPKYRARSERAQREEAAHQQRATLKKDKAKAEYYEGDGDVKIAIGGVNFHRSTSLHVARGNNTFITVYISAKNTGQGIAHVNPNDFTLADQEGSTVSHDTDTYGLSNYFNAVDLRQNQNTGGWLLFYLKRDSRYTLSYQGFGGTAQKAVIP